VDYQATAIVEAILEAPGWVRVGITAPTAGMRERATEELAAMIARRLETPRADSAPGRLHLTI
jgi:hypothetical protein